MPRQLPASTTSARIQPAPAALQAPRKQPPPYLRAAGVCCCCFAAGRHQTSLLETPARGRLGKGGGPLAHLMLPAAAAAAVLPACSSALRCSASSASRPSSACSTHAACSCRHARHWWQASSSSCRGSSVNTRHAAAAVAWCGLPDASAVCVDHTLSRQQTPASKSHGMFNRATAAPPGSSSPAHQPRAAPSL